MVGVVYIVVLVVVVVCNARLVFFLFLLLLVPIFSLIFCSSYPCPLPCLHTVHSDLRPREGQARTLACLGSAAASRLGEREVLALVLALVEEIGVPICIIKGLWLNPTLTTGWPFLVTWLLRGIREGVVERRKL
ncbi:hypothetical protein V8G54_033291 [Vigna mungo]|uniref:Uncharacterized protein n=1 Tax=Vigna mungo TaxID=3915 RepID=A0AAQ3RG77_VIGMU